MILGLYLHYLYTPHAIVVVKEQSSGCNTAVWCLWCFRLDYICFFSPSLSLYIWLVVLGITTITGSCHLQKKPPAPGCCCCCQPVSERLGTHAPYKHFQILGDPVTCRSERFVGRGTAVAACRERQRNTYDVVIVCAAAATDVCCCLLLCCCC